MYKAHYQMSRQAVLAKQALGDRLGSKEKRTTGIVTGGKERDDGGRGKRMGRLETSIGR